MSIAGIQPQVDLKFNPVFVHGQTVGGENQPMTSALGFDIKEALARKERTQSWLAEQLGVSDNAVSKWIKTGSISRANLIRLVKILDLGGPLATLESEPDLSTLSSTKPSASKTQCETVDVNGIGEGAGREDIVLVRVFDARASMGLGAPRPEHDTVVDHLRLTQSWVRANLSISTSVNPLGFMALPA